jgi:hypothetical protein
MFWRGAECFGEGAECFGEGSECFGQAPCRCTLEAFAVSAFDAPQFSRPEYRRQGLQSLRQQEEQSGNNPHFRIVSFFVPRSLQ